MREQLQQIKDELDDLYAEAADSDESNDVVSYIDDAILALEDAIRNLKAEF